MAEYRKKLIEVALPLQAINEASAREKSIRHGHPSTLHLWWARRPLAACRAVLFAQLVDDPDSDPVYRKSDGSVDEEAAEIKRSELFNLIEELVQWENSNNPDVIRSARAEIARCVASRKLELGTFQADQELAPGITVKRFIRDCRCVPIFVGPEKHKKKDDKRRFRFRTAHLPPAEIVNAFLAEHAPPVLDPFAGGGSIPLEAQRLGLRAYASDLNPVAVLINKALIEIPPKFAGQPPINPESRAAGKKLFEKEWKGAQGLAEDVRYYGQWMRDEAEKRIGHLYPKVKVTEAMAKDRPDLKPYIGEELTVIAWLWARTVASPNPAVEGQHVPLISTYVLSKKPGKMAYLEPIINGTQYRFNVGIGNPEPPPSAEAGTKAGKGADFRCIITGALISGSYIKTEGQAGRISYTMTAIVAEGTRGRVYLSPLAEHQRIAGTVVPEWSPNSEFFTKALGFRVGNYGMTRWAHLFTARQLVALSAFSDLVHEVGEVVRKDIASAFRRQTDVEVDAYAYAIAVYLAFARDKSAVYWNSLCPWLNQAKNEIVGNSFGRQTVQMVWDFAEANPLSESGGNVEKQIDYIAKVLTNSADTVAIGTVAQADAATQSSPSPCVVSTDPPYFDNVGYADLSDFFYVWLRRSLRNVYPDLFSTLEVPKAEELVATPARHGGTHQAERFFLNGMSRAIDKWRKQCDENFPVTVYYAFKQAETDGKDGVSSTGWETFLDGLIKAGFSVAGTWPVRTERPGRMRDFGSNALASSIVLVCRARASEAPLSTRREFLTALKRELPDALSKLQSGSIAPVDLAQAAIGPGMAVFSRYSKVMEADGTAMSVRAALTLINQVLDEVLAEQEGEFDGDTRWAVAWFEQYGVDAGPYGVAETLSKAKNTSVQGLVEAGVLTARGGNVKLLARDEMPANWDPRTDTRPTCWEATQHLIRRLQNDGEEAAAELLAKLGGDYGEFARDLAYRLYSICERKKWAQEALAYNGLIVAWPEISKLARAQRVERVVETQPDLFT